MEDEDGGQHYEPSGDESMCIGSAIYMLKIGRPPISMRFALLAKMISLDELTAQNGKIIEPLAQWKWHSPSMTDTSLTLGGP